DGRASRTPAAGRPVRRPATRRSGSGGGAAPPRSRQHLGSILPTPVVGGIMSKVIQCECGFTARGDNDDQVVGIIREHMATDHPDLLDTVSAEDLFSWVRVE